MDSWQDTRGRACYRIKGPLAKDCYVNQFLYIPDDDGDQGLELVVSQVEDSMAELRVVRDYRAAKTSVWGIPAKNREQHFALKIGRASWRERMYRKLYIYWGAVA